MPEVTNPTDLSIDPDDDGFARLSESRHSVRAFLTTPVPVALLSQVLVTARQAPSGANLQPGSLIEVRGAARERLCGALTQAWREGEEEAEDYSYFPDPLPGQLRRRQVAAARALYGSLGIAREDRSGRDAQFARNFCFFDAPVALLVTIESDQGSGGYMDLGMALYGLMLAAQSRELSTCAIGALASFPGLIRRTLGLRETTSIVCGIALGYADNAAPVNQTRTTRANLADYFRVIE
jgi:nitroreductase